MNINQYAVYQLKESAELAAYRSRSYQYLTEHHFQVIVQNYQQAYGNRSILCICKTYLSLIHI